MDVGWSLNRLSSCKWGASATPPLAGLCAQLIVEWGVCTKQYDDSSTIFQCFRDSIMISGGFVAFCQGFTNFYGKQMLSKLKLVGSKSR